ncbi:amidohydrolase family protein [Pseudoflavitalea sp. G-6-1-2]|uniref:amidohydrolase family protein n=1 Tax=Pseudoflavitalea sp. G-6-1-2 TaxID=2728841 RepID=UPI001469CD34|nr:amidohydrolase family protein [Pseudoflavitalea sp. G-6-1-2]NML22245.1 amidohydrolase family protein [Pseudoflavitalea sp. G-6-1-2]
MKKLTLFLFSLAFVFAGSTATAQVANKILLSNATIIDGDAKIAPRKGSVLIENGIISKIRFGKTIKTGKDVTVIDCSGKFITPGMTDAHVHLATLDLSDMQKARKITDSILYNLLRHGITTVRDMAGDARFLNVLSKSAEKENLHSPSIVYAAQFAGPEYFEMMNRGRKGTDGKSPWVRSITDTSDIRKAIAEAKACGVTGIKIYAELSASLVQQITKEAHAQGLLAWSHAAVNPALPLEIAEAGVNSMSHAGDLLFQQFPAGTDLTKVWGAIYKGLKADSAQIFPVLQQMKNHHIYFDPTLFHNLNNKLTNAAVIARWANRLGVQMVAGTDWVYPTTNEAVPLMNELQHLVLDAGLSNAAAIQAATLNGARVSGFNDRGLVRKKMRADLLVLDADPLEHTNALFSPSMVIRKGNVIRF